MGRLVAFDGVDGVDGVAGEAVMFRIGFREITISVTWNLES
jgi:hypothetical protein